MRYLCLLVVLLCGIQVYGQNGLTKYNINTKYSSHFHVPIVHNDILFFSAYADSIYGVEGCMYDNVNAPTITFDLYKGEFSGRFFPILGYLDSIFFIGADKRITEYSVLKYDIVNDTVNLITDSNILVSSDVYAGAGSKLYYTGHHRADTLGRHVFEYDISAGTIDTVFTLPFTDSLYPHKVNKLTLYGNTLYINEGNGGYENGLYTYKSITKKLDTVVDQVKFEVSKNMAMLNNKVYFTMYDSLIGFELYEYDGANAPKLIADYNAGMHTTVIASEEYEMVAYNNEIYFTGFLAPSSSSVKALLKYSPATNKISPVYPDTNYYQKEFVSTHKFVYNNKLYMNGIAQFYGWELYVYDGTKPPYIAVEIAPENNHITKSAHIHDFILYKGDLFFGAHDANTDNEMYRYNDSTLSITNITATSFLNITPYPNPTNDDAHLEVTLPQATSFIVQLTDMNGRVVYRSEQQLFSKGKHNITIPMRQLSAGTYVYSVINNRGILLGSGRLTRQ